jgi:hypothetical protein
LHVVSPFNSFLLVTCQQKLIAVKANYSTVTQALNRDPRFQTLQAHLVTLVSIQKVLDTQWPLMRLKVRSMKDGNLSLTAASAAQAAKLRQIEPSILAALQAQVGEVTRISFKPQTRNGNIEPVRQPPKSISEKTLKVISQSAIGVTHPAILAALEHLKKRARRPD